VSGLLPASAQNYISSFGGTAGTLNSDVRFIQPATQTDVTYRNASWNLAPKRSAPYWGVRFGGYFRRQRHLGLEFSYTHTKAVLNLTQTVNATGTINGLAVNGLVRIGDTIQKLELLNGVNIFALHLLYRTMERGSPSFPQGRLQFYTGIGPAFFWLHNNNRVFNTDQDDHYQASGIGYSALVGVSYGLARPVSLTLEGRFTSGFGRVDTANGGILESPLDSWHFHIGVKYRL
jgi:opacity protein-like surface antigen